MSNEVDGDWRWSVGERELARATPMAEPPPLPNKGLLRLSSFAFRVHPRVAAGLAEAGTLPRVLTIDDHFPLQHRVCRYTLESIDAGSLDFEAMAQGYDFDILREDGACRRPRMRGTARYRGYGSGGLYPPSQQTPSRCVVSGGIALVMDAHHCENALSECWAMPPLGHLPSGPRGGTCGCVHNAEFTNSSAADPTRAKIDRASAAAE